MKGIPYSSILTAASILATFAPAVATSQEPAACSTEIESAFDFWVGDWTVYNAEGEVVGENTIRRMAGRCGLAENWRGASGNVGESLNYHDPADGLWHQLWIDNNGLILRLEGAPYRDGMRMIGRASGPERTALHRITWSPLDDGSVRQLWEVSEDGGGEWSRLFEGYYRKSNSPPGGGELR